MHCYSLDGVPAELVLGYRHPETGEWIGGYLDELSASVKPGDLVLVDCFYRLTPDGNEVKEVAEALERLKRFASSTQAAVLLVDHFRKAGADKARDRFAGSFVKQAAPSTLVAIEASGDVLGMSIDARTFHGLNTVHCRFDLESYSFRRVSESEVAAGKEDRAAADAVAWLLAVWKARPLTATATKADASAAWAIDASGASRRFGKLEARGLVEVAEEHPGRAKAWGLTADGKEKVGFYSGLHTSAHTQGK